MNTTNTNKDLNVEPTITNRYLQSCRKLLAGIEQAKNKVLNDFHVTLEPHHKSFKLALNEAEALAWQTAYPHLVFPSLAVEKFQTVVAWQTRQQSLHKHRSVFAEAA
jgi:hypothetical protein